MSVMRVILCLPEQPDEDGHPRTVICDVVACQGPAGLLSLIPREQVSMTAGEMFALELNTRDVP